MKITSELEGMGGRKRTRDEAGIPNVARQPAAEKKSKASRFEDDEFRKRVILKKGIIKERIGILEKRIVCIRRSFRPGDTYRAMNKRWVEGQITEDEAAVSRFKGELLDLEKVYSLFQKLADVKVEIKEVEDTRDRMAVPEGWSGDQAGEEWRDLTDVQLKYLGLESVLGALQKQKANLMDSIELVAKRVAERGDSLTDFD